MVSHSWSFTPLALFHPTIPLLKSIKCNWMQLILFKISSAFPDSLWHWGSSVQWPTLDEQLCIWQASMGIASASMCCWGPWYHRSRMWIVEGGRCGARCVQLEYTLDSLDTILSHFKIFKLRDCIRTVWQYHNIGCELWLTTLYHSQEIHQNLECAATVLVHWFDWNLLNLGSTSWWAGQWSNPNLPFSLWWF